MNIRDATNATTWLALTSLALFSLVGCGVADGGSDDDGGGAPSYKDQKLQGKVAGSSWTVSHGTVESGITEGEKRIELYAADKAPDDPCTFDVASYEGWTVNFSTPLEKKKWQLGNKNFLTFSKAPENVATKTGWYEITAVKDSQIEGKLVAKRDSKHVVIGKFTAKRCKSDNGF